MSEKTRKVTVRKMGFTTARLDYESVEVEIPADTPADEAYNLAIEKANEIGMYDVERTVTFEDKDEEVEYEVDDPDAPSDEDEDEEADDDDSESGEEATDEVEE